jgi:hypothetical protein
MDVLWVVVLLVWLPGLAFAAWLAARLTPPRRYAPAEEMLRLRFPVGHAQLVGDLRRGEERHERAVREDDRSGASGR